jgi:hypothetical protein
MITEATRSSDQTHALRSVVVCGSQQFTKLRGNCNHPPPVDQALSDGRGTKPQETLGYKRAVAQGFEPWEACTSHAFEA